MIIILIVVAVLLVAGFLQFAGAATKRGELQRGMASLGDVTQHTYDDVTAVLGNPNSLSMINDVKLAQWMASGYHVAMSFDQEGKCLGIDHEVAV